MDKQCGPHECKPQKTQSETCSCCDKEMSACSCCPPSKGGKDMVEMAVSMWHKAAFEALFELKKEKLKQKFDVKYGLSLEKAADVIVESFTKKFKAMEQQSNSDKELHDKLAAIMKETLQN